jgi:hypothetical protein
MINSTTKDELEQKNYIPYIALETTALRTPKKIATKRQVMHNTVFQTLPTPLSCRFGNSCYQKQQLHLHLSSNEFNLSARETSSQLQATFERFKSHVTDNPVIFLLRANKKQSSYNLPFF